MRVQIRNLTAAHRDRAGGRERSVRAAGGQRRTGEAEHGVMRVVVDRVTVVSVGVGDFGRTALAVHTVRGDEVEG